MELAAVIVAAAAATAAWLAAWSSYRAVRLSHQAFVYGEAGLRYRTGRSDQGGGFIADEEPSHAAVRLHNDGPGTAFDVRCRIESENRSFTSETAPPTRALQGGEALPPQGFDAAELELPLPPDRGAPWTLVVRYSDVHGASWETRNPRHPESGRLEHHRLRSGRIDFWHRPRDW